VVIVLMDEVYEMRHRIFLLAVEQHVELQRQDICRLCFGQSCIFFCEGGFDICKQVCIFPMSDLFSSTAAARMTNCVE